MGQLKQCCCCFSLRTGTLIIGILDLIGSLLYLGGVTAYSLRHHISNHSPQDNEQPQDGEPATGYTVYFYYLLSFNILHFICAIVLIIGANQFKAMYIIPWLVVSIAGLTLNLIGVVAYSVFFILSAVSHKLIQLLVTVHVIALIVYLPAFAFAIYMVRVVFSFYKSIKNLNRNQQNSCSTNMSEHL